MTMVTEHSYVMFSVQSQDQALEKNIYIISAIALDLFYIIIIIIIIIKTSEMALQGNKK